jgi:ABC-type glycerol-3-phosphate transport system permease component
LTGKPTEQLMMAGVTVATIPCILLFAVAQRYFVRGIVTSGFKGAGA